MVLEVADNSYLRERERLRLTDREKDCLRKTEIKKLETDRRVDRRVTVM